METGFPSTNAPNPSRLTSRYEKSVVLGQLQLSFLYNDYLYHRLNTVCHLRFGHIFHVTVSSSFLHHAVENTANQNTEKPLYIRRYYIQPSHHAPRVCRFDCVIFYGVV